MGGERGFRELEELLGGGLEGVGREGLEGVRELGFGAFEQRLFFGGGLEFGVEAGAEFGELVAEGLGVLLVALGLGGHLREAGLDFRGAAFLGLQALDAGGDFARGGEAGEQPADEKARDGGDDEREIGCEFWRNHGGFLLRVAESSVS